MRNPFHGELIERATDQEYKKGYNCEKIGCEWALALVRGAENTSEVSEWTLFKNPCCLGAVLKLPIFFRTNGGDMRTISLNFKHPRPS